MIRQTGGAGDQTRDPWVPGEWFKHYITVAPLKACDLSWQDIFMYTDSVDPDDVMYSLI